jgi:hypothetical protein
MIRTQISLDKNEYDLAQKQAAALNTSISEFHPPRRPRISSTHWSRSRLDEIRRVRRNR